jgi:hypothetical protein
MKATTFIAAQNRRIADRAARLSARSHARAACVPAVAERGVGGAHHAMERGLEVGEVPAE